MNETEYAGFFAEFYDLLHANNIDIKVYPRLLKDYGKTVLELGAGTGRIAIPLAKAGYQVTALEYSADMIRVLEEKEYPKENLSIVQGDARTYSLLQRFDAILLTCNFINHFISSDDVLNILKNSARHLNVNGVIIIDCSIPETSFMCESNGKEEVFDFKTSKGTLIKDYFTAKYDLLNQKELDYIKLEEYDGKVLIRHAEANEELTYYYPREIRSLIREAGLKIVRESGALWDPDKDIAISEENGEMIFYCGL